MKKQSKFFKNGNLSYWFKYFDGGRDYMGYTIEDIFKKLIPQNYSKKFLFRLLCVLNLLNLENSYKYFLQQLKKYKNSPIIEYKTIKCSCCHNTIKTNIIWCKRIGKYFNQKGQEYYYTPKVYDDKNNLKENWWKYCKKYKE